HLGRRRNRPVYRRVAHAGRGRQGGGGDGRLQHAEAGFGARRIALRRSDHARRIPQAHRNRRGSGATLPAGVRDRAVSRGHELDRRIVQLKIEREALKKEHDPASQDRLQKLEKELQELEGRSAELTAQWQAEKDKLAGAQKVKEQLDHARAELEQAQRRGDWARAGELTYGVIPELERKLNEAE